MNISNNYKNHKTNLNNRYNQLATQNKWNKKKIYMTSKDAFEKERLNWRSNKLPYRSLIKQYNEVKNANRKLDKKLTLIVARLERIEKEQEKNNSRKDAYINKRYVLESQPMTRIIYNQLINDKQTTTVCQYKNIRLRVALCILFLTGISLSQLVTLQVYQLQTLVKNHWISIHHFKRDSNNSKAFLTEEGKKILQAREKDFEIIFHNKIQNSYIFTSEFRPDRMLRRETMSRDINQRIKSVSSHLPHKISITTRSFCSGDIKDLWEDSGDIEFVRHSIYRQTLNTTCLSHYSGSG